MITFKMHLDHLKLKKNENKQIKKLKKINGKYNLKLINNKDS